MRFPLRPEEGPFRLIQLDIANAEGPGRPAKTPGWSASPMGACLRSTGSEEAEVRRGFCGKFAMPTPDGENWCWYEATYGGLRACRDE